jgi:hypothetical protein
MEVNMTVKEALKEVFRYMLEYYSKTEKGYPNTVWSPTIDPKIYVGEKNQSGWICWKPIYKDVVHDFKCIEKELGVNIHPSLKEYFNSYWFLYLPVPYKKMNFNLVSVPPGEEFIHILRRWKDAKEYFGSNLYLALGSEYNGKYDLIINNNTGEVATFNHDTKKVQVICDNLADFIYSPLKNLKNR